MKEKISVIIPTYNSETYLKRLLNNIYENKNIEIIIINDASNDNTDKLIKEYPNIKYYKNKKNKGIAYSRNKGIELVETKYFTFIDSDDEVDSEIFNIMYNECEDNNLDMCICNYKEIINNQEIKSKYTYNNEIYNNKQLLEETFKDKISTVVWAKLYKTKTYKDIKFNEELRLNEDYEYIIRCFLKSKKIKIINKYLYKYNKNNTSITNNLTCKIVKDNNYLYCLNNLNLNIFNNYNYFININELRNIHTYIKCIDKKNIYTYLKKEINKDKLKSLLKTNLSIFNKLEIIIFIISIRLYILIYPLLIKIKNLIRR